MTYKHGVYIQEQATSVISPVQVDSAIPFVIGTAPINMGKIDNVNKPTLVYTYQEAVAAFGMVEANENGDFDYTISEFIKSHFALYGKAPIVFVNVLNPTEHKKTVTDEAIVFANGRAVIAKTGGIVSSVVVKKDAATAVIGTDYELTWKNGLIQINAIDGGILDSNPAGVKVTYDHLDPSMVTATDIIGGVDVSTGKNTGLELINEVYPRFRTLVGLVVVPKFSGDVTVAAVMKAKADTINSTFKAITLHDVPTGTVKKYTDVAAWKNQNNLTDPSQVVLWPMLSLGGVKYHMSTQAAGVIAQTDSDFNDIPYASPSNHNVQADSTVLADGTEVFLGVDQAAYLNGEGIVTAINWIGGWKLWGNNTAAYPANTDVKDRFIPVKRMFYWIGNTLVQTYWQKLDLPLNKRQIDTIVDSVQIWLNSLVATGALLGGKIEFLESENSTIDLLDGKAKFHLYITPPTPNEVIEFVLEYDVNNLANLFE